jgi:Protein of unknown function (DUF2612)
VIVKVEDHVAQAQGFFIEQFQEKPRMAAWLGSYTSESQELEEAIWDSLWKRLIDNAQGQQLDMIGAIVLEPRNSRGDAEYKPYVYAKIRINWSQGNPDDVIDVIRIVESADFRYRELYPAGFEVQMLEVPTVSPGTLGDLACRAKAAGMAGLVVDSGHVDAETFQFCGGDEDGPSVDAGDVGTGFARGTEDTGGYLSGTYGRGTPNVG